MEVDAPEPQPGTAARRPEARRDKSPVEDPEKIETARRHGPVFLERDTYRARRWIDVARILPVVGACLWSVPLLWQQAAVNTSVAGLFIFGIWCLLVVVSYTLSNRLRRNSVMTEPADPGRVETSR